MAHKRSTIISAFVLRWRSRGTNCATAAITPEATSVLLRVLPSVHVRGKLADCTNISVKLAMNLRAWPSATQQLTNACTKGCINKNGHQPTGSLDALAVNNHGPTLIVLCLRDPHLLEGAQRREDGATDPHAVLLSGGAMTLTFTVEGARAQSSLVMRSPMPGNIVDPPDRTTF